MSRMDFSKMSPGLLERVKAGEDAAFRELQYIARPLLRALVKKYTQHWRRFIEEEDALQIARLGLWKAALDWNPSGGSKFPTWAYLRIRWELIGMLKKTLGTGSTFVARQRELSEWLDHGEEGYERVEHEDLRIRSDLWYVTPWTDSLPEKLSQVVHRRADGLTYQEIGDEIGMTGSGAQAMVKKLRRELRREEEEELGLALV